MIIKYFRFLLQYLIVFSWWFLAFTMLNHLLTNFAGVRFYSTDYLTVHSLASMNTFFDVSVIALLVGARKKLGILV